MLSAQYQKSIKFTLVWNLSVVHSIIQFLCPHVKYHPDSENIKVQE